MIDNPIYKRLAAMSKEERHKLFKEEAEQQSILWYGYLNTAVVEEKIRELKKRYEDKKL